MTATGLKVSVPSAPWLALVSPAVLGDLAPGASAKIVLLLTPTSTLPLGVYTGQITVNGSNATLSVPFSLDCISDATGSVKVTSSDEFTYFATDKPPLAGATVTLTNPNTGAVALTGTTDDQGELTQPGIPEGSYDIEVTSPDHDAYRGSVQITAGKETDIAAFLSRQLVTYQFTVVPLDLQDHYDVELQAIFQTNVPAPVVTISPAQVDLTQLQFDANGQAVVYLTITNHGLIAANDVALNLPTRSDYALTAPTTSFGTLAALSTVIVPVTITNLALAPASIKAAMAHDSTQMIGSRSVTALDSGGGGCFAATVEWDYFCGSLVPKSATIYFKGIGCFASGGYVPPSVIGGVGGGSIRIPTGVAEFRSCNECDIERLKELTDCAIDLAEDLALDLLFPEGKAAKLIKCFISATKTGASCTKNVTKILQDNPNPTVVGNLFTSCVIDYEGTINECFFENLPIIGTGITLVNCAFKIVTACDGIKEDSRPLRGAISASTHLDGEDAISDPYVASLQIEAQRLLASISPMVVLFGDEKWFNGIPTDGTVFTNFYVAFVNAISASDGTGRKVSDADRVKLLAMPLPSQITQADVTKLINRWNRSIDYYSEGIYTVSQVPPGQSTDFVDINVFANATAAAETALDADQADGYTNGLIDGVNQAEQALQANIIDRTQQTGTCATVKIQLDQTVAITRTAFKATLQLGNAAANVPLTGIKVALKITDQAGNDQTSLFVIGKPAASGFNAVDGTGTLQNGVTGTATWTILPTRAAAANGTTQYFVTGEIDYTQSGASVTIPLFPTGITVVPDPYLKFHYFLQRNVYSDDPFTTQVEPAEPFALGLLVVNEGQGTARNLTITSSQPQIVDNQKGLAIGFDLIGTQVNTEPVSPSLTVDLGDIAPNGGTGVADFFLTASLAGQFIAESASFKHIDDLGNAQTSLIDSVDIHSLEHIVRLDQPSDDGKPDFLTDDIPDANNLPDHVYSSDGAVYPVAALTNATVDKAVSSSNLVVHLTVPTVPSGWIYIRTDDPALGNFQLVQVVRSDGRVIRLGDNAWTTNRLIHLTNQTPYKQYRLYLFDKDSTGSYTLYYAQNPPVSAPVGGMKGLPDGTPVQFGDIGTNVMGTGLLTGGSIGVGAAVPTIVTAVFPDVLYIENSDRSAGIKVIPETSAGSAAVGDVVTGLGVIRTDTNGERYIDAASLAVIGTGQLDPLAITTKTLYSGDYFYDGSTGAGQKGMVSGAGLTTVGEYVRTLGKVTGVGNGAFTMTDGYSQPVTVQLPAGASLPGVGGFAGVTGIVSVLPTAQGLTPQLRPRSAADLAYDLSSIEGIFTSPNPLLNAGDNLFSLPGIPMNPAPPAVLAGVGPSDGSGLIGRLFRYDAPSQMEVLWDAAGTQGLFGNLLLDEGYGLHLDVGVPQAVTFSGLNAGFDDIWISLPHMGATLIGDPFDFAVDWSTVWVNDGTRMLSLTEATKTITPTWINSTAKYLDSVTHKYKHLGLPVDKPDSTQLLPWFGYFVTSQQDNLALVVPVHASQLVLSSLSPNTVQAGGPAFLLVVGGANFNANSVVNWNGQPLVTTYVSATQLKAQVPDTDIVMTGTASVTVSDPVSLPVSEALPFTITPGSSAPTLSGLSLPEATQNTTFPLTLFGSGFIAGSTVRLSGGSVPITLTPASVTSSRILVTIPALVAGTYQIAVLTPAGVASNVQPLAVGLPQFAPVVNGKITRTNASITIPIVLQNVGTGTALSATLSMGRINGVPATDIPISVGQVAPIASSSNVNLIFPASAVPTGTHTATVFISGVYIGITSAGPLPYSAALRIALP